MKALSLFSGIGGLDLAAEAAGIEIAGMCEIDGYCRCVLRERWPGVNIHDDIKTLRGDRFGQVDIVYGGPPCQPVSVAGRQRGPEDERFLWPDFLRIVEEAAPRWVVAENPAGVLSIAGDWICQDLERQGYEVGVFDFEAAAVGALHRRERVFFVGHAECGGLSRTTRRRSGEESADGCSDVSDTYSTGVRGHESIGRRAREAEQTLLGSEPATNPNCERLQDFQRSVPHSESDGNGTAFERHCTDSGYAGWLPQSRLGRVAHGIPLGLDELAIEPDIPRIARGVKDRVARLRALGNAVVPAQAYPIFCAIAAIEGFMMGND